MFILPDVGEQMALKVLVNFTAQANITLHLYTNSVVIDGDSVAADFVESVAIGYAAKTLTGGSWQINSVNGTTTAAYPEQTFTIASAETLYGYYCMLNGDLLLAEEFADAPIDIDAGGANLHITPKIRCSSNCGTNGSPGEFLMATGNGVRWV